MNRRTSFLHLQLGQETIYLLLATSLASALILAIIAAQQSTRLNILEAAQNRDLPPIVRLSETSGYSFSSGRADISPQFRDLLRQRIVPQLAEYRREYDVTVIEVVGHTDEQPLGPAGSSLDADLLPLLAGSGSSPELTPSPGDNVGLGMLRAVAVANELSADPRVAGMIVLPLSAGQTTETSDELAAPGGARADRTRRRIEIRMRRRSEVAPEQN